MNETNANDTKVNTFESRIRGYTVTGEAHSLSAWFVLSLRLMMGYAFLHAGFVEMMEAGWDARGYLTHVAAANGNPLQGCSAGWLPRRGSSTS